MKIIYPIKYFLSLKNQAKLLLAGLTTSLIILCSNNTYANDDSSRVRSMAQWERTGAIIFSWQQFILTLFEPTDSNPIELAKKIILFDQAKCSFIKTSFDAIIAAGADIVVTDNIDGQFEQVAQECEVDISTNVMIVPLEGDEINCYWAWARDTYAYPVYENNHGSRSAIGLRRCTQATDALGIKSNVLQNEDFTSEQTDLLLGILGQEALRENQTFLDLLESNIGGLYLEGGNYMTDGQGLLILEEGRSYQSIPEAYDFVDQHYRDAAGITNFIKLPNHRGHIDYNVKLLNEETIVLSKPTENSGGRHEQNLEFYNSVKETLSSTTSWTGRPFKVIDLPEVERNLNEDYDVFSLSYFANSLIVNDTILVGAATIPGIVDHAEEDAEIKRIYEEAMPGYNVVMLPYSSIVNKQQGGIHCLTSVTGDKDPVYIAHKWLDGTVDYSASGYTIDADIGSVNGIKSAEVFWREKGQKRYKNLRMRPTNKWASSNKGVISYSARIPGIRQGTTIEYYIQAKDKHRKTEKKPFVAPKGNYSFTVGDKQRRRHYTPKRKYSFFGKH